MKKANLISNTRGLSTVEYIIILALIAVGGIGLWTTFGTQLQAKIRGANTEMNALPETAPE